MNQYELLDKEKLEMVGARGVIPSPRGISDSLGKDHPVVVARQRWLKPRVHVVEGSKSARPEAASDPSEPAQPAAFAS